MTNVAAICMLCVFEMMDKVEKWPRETYYWGIVKTNFKTVRYWLEHLNTDNKVRSYFLVYSTNIHATSETNTETFASTFFEFHWHFIINWASDHLRQLQLRCYLGTRLFLYTRTKDLPPTGKSLKIQISVDKS